MHFSRLRSLLSSPAFALLLACASAQKQEPTVPLETTRAESPAAEPSAQPTAQPVAVSTPAPVAADGGAAPEAQPAAAPAPVVETNVDDPSRFVDVVTEEGQRARGAYFNGPLARKLGARKMIDLVRGAGLNAVVIDIKDGEGRVTYDTKIPELQLHKRVYLKDPNEYVRTLKEAGVYTIARVVCFNDSVLPKAEPDRSILDGRPGHEGEVWLKDSKRNTWLDPYNTKNHDTIVALAKDVEAMGFDEIQLDYIRFPVDTATKFAVFPAASDKPRGQVILGLLRRIDEAVHIPIGVDVFGLTALRKSSDSTDLLGQDLEAWTAHVEVFSPMLYVNGMKDWMRHVTQGRAGLLVQQAVTQVRKRLGDQPVIRPFIQAFERGADYYNAEFIAEQIRGSRQGGGDGFLFWHPASSYGMVRAGMMGPARALFPFPIEARRAQRDEAWNRARGTAPATPMRAVANEPGIKPAS